MDEVSFARSTRGRRWSGLTSIRSDRVEVNAIHRRVRSLVAFACVLLGVAAMHAADPRPAPLDALAASFGGWTPLREVRTFAYRLMRLDAQGVVTRDERYRLDLETGHVWSRDLRTGIETWWDGAAGWCRAVTDGDPARDDVAGARLRSHAAFNFFRLLRDPATRAEWTGERRIRLTPTGEEAFEVELDPVSGRIVANHFAGGFVSDEADYQPVGALVWPMEFRVPGANAFTGRFSEVELSREPALPASR
jgi:hypothetical protein